MAEGGKSSLAMAEGGKSHPLLEELKGLLARLTMITQPVKDGDTHLVPFCETLESIFRNGLKQPNSWFGLNKQDYWSWIELLQDYYYNQKQNPLFRDLVKDISLSTRIRSLQGRGRCFLRAALCHKLISVPIEHLVKSVKLTQYWYNDSSIIGDSTLRVELMELLFQATNITFELNYMKSSFLDETWIIPVFVTYKLPPVKTLDISVKNVEGRELIIEVEKGCLAEKAGVEVWDVVVELCGQPVHNIPSGRLQNYLAKHSVNHSEITVVKKYLSDGSPFAPILRRQLSFTHQMTTPTSSAWIPEFLNGQSSSVIKTVGECTEYNIVFLGKLEIVAKDVDQALIDSVISRVLNDSRKPEEIILSVGKDIVSILSPTSKEQHLCESSYGNIAMCGRSTHHRSCLSLIVFEGIIQDRSPKTKKDKHYNCYVCETPTCELAQCICMHIAQGFIACPHDT